MSPFFIIDNYVCVFEPPKPTQPAWLKGKKLLILVKRRCTSDFRSPTDRLLQKS